MVIRASQLAAIVVASVVACVAIAASSVLEGAPWGGEPGAIPGILVVPHFDIPGNTSSHFRAPNISKPYRTDTAAVFDQDGGGGGGLWTLLSDTEWAVFTMQIPESQTVDVLPHVCTSSPTPETVSLMISVGVDLVLTFPVPYSADCGRGGFELDPSLARHAGTFSPSNATSITVAAVSLDAPPVHARVGHVYFLPHPPAPFATHTHPVLQAEDYDIGAYGFRVASPHSAGSSNSTYRVPMPLAHVVSGRGDGAELVQVRHGDWLNWTVAGWPVGFYHPNAYAVFDAADDSLQLRFHLGNLSALTAPLTATSPPRVEGFEGGFVVTDEMAAGSFSIAVEVVAATAGAYLDKLSFSFVPFVHPVPGVVEAEAFGFPAAAHSTALNSTLSTRFRTDSAIAIEQNVFPGAHRIVLEQGERVTYNLRFDAPGLYKLIVMGFRTSLDTTVRLQLTFDDHDEAYLLPLLPLHTFYKATFDLGFAVENTSTMTRMSLSVPPSSQWTQSFVIDRILIFPLSHSVTGSDAEVGLAATDYDQGFSWASHLPLLRPGSNATQVSGRPHFLQTITVPSISGDAVCLQSGDHLNYTLSNISAGWFEFTIRAFAPESGTLTLHVGAARFTTAPLLPKDFYNNVSVALRQSLPNSAQIVVRLVAADTRAAICVHSWALRRTMLGVALPGTVPAADFETAVSTRWLPPSFSYRPDANISITHITTSSDVFFLATLRSEDAASYLLVNPGPREYLVILASCARSPWHSANLLVTGGVGDAIVVTIPFEPSCGARTIPRSLTTWSMRFNESEERPAIHVRLNGVFGVPQSSERQSVVLSSFIVGVAGPVADHTIPGTVEAEAYDISAENRGRLLKRVSTRRTAQHAHVHETGGVESISMVDGGVAVFTVNASLTGLHSVWIVARADGGPVTLVVAVTIDETSFARELQLSGAGWQIQQLGNADVFMNPRSKLLMNITAVTPAHAAVLVDRIHVVREDVSGAESTVRYPVSEPVAFYNYSVASDTTFWNQGNASEVRPGSRTDISTCVGCYSGFAVHYMDDGEGLRYLLSSEAAGVYTMSVSMASLVESAALTLGPSWKVFVSGQEEFALEVQTRGGLAAPAPGQGRDGNRWNYTLGPVYLPQGNITLTFIASVAAGSTTEVDTALLFFDRFAFVPTRLPFAEPSAPMNYSVEAEHYDFHLGTDVPRVNAADAGSGADVRDDLLHPLVRDGNDVFVDLGLSRKAQYTLYIKQGTFRSRFRVWTPNGTEATAVLLLRIGKRPPDNDPWSSAVEAEKVISFATRTNVTFSVGTEVDFTCERSGVYQLEVGAAGEEGRHSDVLLDRFDLVQIAGIFGEAPVPIPGALIGYRADLGTVVDSTPTNTGNRVLRDDALDTSFDPLWRDIVVVAIEASEAITFTAAVAEAGTFGVRFSGETDSATTHDSPGLIDITLNGVSYSGLFRIEQAGRLNRTHIGAISIPFAADSVAIRLTFRTSRFASFYSLELEPQLVSTSVLPDGELRSMSIRSIDFDVGGRGLAFEASDTLISVGRDNGRSGEVVNVKSMTTLTFNSSGFEWVRYTFRADLTRGGMLRASVAGTMPLQFVMTPPLIDVTRTPRSAGNATSVDLGRVAFVAGATYTLRVAIPSSGAAAAEGDSTELHSVWIDPSFAPPMPVGCFAANTSSTPDFSGCAATAIETSSCSRVASDAVSFERPLSFTVEQCSVSEQGRPVELPVPAAMGSVSGLFLRMDRRVILSHVAPGRSFLVNEFWSNGAFLVLFTSQGFTITDLQTGRRVQDVVIGSSISSFEFTSSGLAAVSFSGAQRTASQLFSGSGLQTMALLGCRWVLSSATPQSLTSVTDSRWLTYRSWCPHSQADDPRSQVQLVYSSGRAENVGSLVSEAPNLPAGLSVAFAPRPRLIAQVPLSNCGDDPEGIGSGAPAPLAHTRSTSLPMAAIAAAPAAGETLVAVRLTSYDPQWRPVVTGVAWVRGANECALAPFVGKVASDFSVVHGVEFVTGVDVPSATTRGDCAAACSQLPSCLAWSISTMSGEPRCHLSSSSFIPELSPRLDSAALATIGVKASRLSVSHHLPHIAEQSLLKRQTFPPASGWRSFLISNSAPLTVSVSNASEIALSVPAAAFTQSSDFVLLMLGTTLAKQCGAAFEPFDRSSELFREGPSAGNATSCGQLGLATCGPAVIHVPAAAEQVLHVLWSPHRSLSPCADAFSVLRLKGDLSAGSGATLFEAVPTTSLTLPRRPGLLRDVRRPQLGSGYIFRQFESESEISSLGSGTTLVVACEFASAMGYEIWDGVAGIGVDDNCVTSFETVEAIAAACDGNTQCVGFTTVTSSGAAETPRCLQFAASGINRSANATLMNFYSKLRPEGLSCRYTVTAAVATAALEVTFGDWAQPANFITILVNGEPRFRCGGIYGFHDDSRPPRSSQCTRLASCFDGPLHLRQGDAVDITIEPTVADIGQCPYAAVALLTLRSSTRPHFSSVATMQHRLWRLPAVGISDHHVRFNTLRSVGMTYVSLGDAQASVGEANRFDLKVIRRTPEFEMPSLHADGVGDPDEGLTELQDTSTIRCAGREHPSVDNVSAECGEYMLCTNVSQPRATPPFFAPFRALRGDLVLGHRATTGWPCTTGFGSVAATSGLLVFDGVTVITQLERSLFRTFSAMQGTFGQVQGNVTTLLERLAAEFPVPSRAADLRVWWSELTVRHSVLAAIGAASPPVTYVLYDDVSVDEREKARPGSEAFCIIDTFMDRGINVGCKAALAAETNYVSVRVAQTLFADPRFTVMVTLGSQQQVICGGGNTFNGVSSRLSGQCNLYLTCFEGRVTAGAGEVTVMFSSPTTAEACSPAASALIQQRTINFTATVCPPSSLTCHVDGKCIPPFQICDGAVDCSDGNDEARCTSWRLLSRTEYQRCNTNVTVRGEAVISFEDCRRWALTEISTGAEAASSISMLFQENRHCVALGCLRPQDPQLTSIPEEFRGALFYAYLESTAEFAGCTNDLSCNGRGVVASATPPCRCTCRNEFIGANCEARRSIAAISDLLLVTERRLTEPERTTYSAALTTFVTTQMGFATDVALLPYDAHRTVLAEADRRRRTTELGSYYVLDFVSLWLRSEKEEVLWGLSAAPAQQAVLAQLEAAIPGLRVREFAALSAMELTRTVQCSAVATTMETAEAGNTTRYACSVPPVSDSRDNLVLLDYTATFHGVASAGLLFSGHLEQGELVACDSVIEEAARESGGAGDACEVSAVCRKAVLAPLRNFTFQPSVDASAALCDAGQQSISVTITYTAFVPSPSVPVDVGTDVKTSDIYTAGASAAIAGMVLLSVTLIASIIAAGVAHVKGKIWFRAFAWFMCIMSAVAIPLVVLPYLDGVSQSATHHVHITEYRSMACSTSSLPMAYRVSRLPADDTCHRIEVSGPSEGAFFAKALCGDREGGGTTDGRVRIIAARTLRGCEGAASLAVLDSRVCWEERVLFPSKSPVELQFMEVSCMSRADSDARWSLINQEFNPSVAVEESTSQQTPPQEITFAPDSRTATFYRSFALTRTPTLRGVTQQVSLASVSNANTALITFPDMVLWEGEMPWPGYLGDTGPEAISNTAQLFGAHTTSTPLTGSTAARTAMRYFGVKGSEFDFGTHDEFTLSFWLRAGNTTRGFVVVAADNWFDRESLSSPIVERVLEVLENGQSADKYFSRDWHMYFGVYADAAAGTISLVFADPVQGASGEPVREFSWDLNMPAVRAAGDVFGDTWQFITIGYGEENGRHFAQLFVNGRSSFSDPGWRICFPRGAPPLTPMVDPGGPVLINDVAVESALSQGVLYVGHINAGVFDVQVHERLLEQQAIVSLGTPGMERYATVFVPQSLGLGWTLISSSIFFFMVAIGILVFRIRKARKEQKMQIEAAKQSLQKGANSIKTTLAFQSATDGVALSQSHLYQFLPEVLTPIQTLGMYFSGWRWPIRFEVNLWWLFQWFALDLNLSFPDIPPVLVPLLQIIAVAIIIVLLLTLFAKDQKRFEQCMSPSNTGDLPTASDFHPQLTPKFLWCGYEVSEGSSAAVQDAILELWDKVKVATPESMVSKDVAAIVLVDPEKKKDDWTGTGTIEVTKRVAESLKGDVVLKMPLMGAEAYGVGQQVTLPHSGKLICEIKENKHHLCPQHQCRLIAALDSVHQRVRREDGKLKYRCIHSDGPGFIYRVLHKDEDVRVCHSIEHANGDFFVCQDDRCSFAVCAECTEMGFATSTIAKGLATKYSLVRRGVLGGIGFVALQIADFVYMPIMKNVLMIIYCHPSYQCQFPTCYSPATAEYVVFVLISWLTALVFGLGFVVFLFTSVVRRQLYIRENMPSLFDENGEMDSTTWRSLLKKDNTMLSGVYGAFSFKFMWMRPVALALKFCTVLPVVFAPPNSLTQLVVAAFIEGFTLLAFIITSPSVDHWIGFATHTGSLHTLAQLGLMCFYRVDVFRNPSNDRMADAMFVNFGIFAFCVLLTITFAVIVPFFRERAAKKQRLRELHLKAMETGSHARKQSVTYTNTQDFGETPGGDVAEINEDGEHEEEEEEEETDEAVTKGKDADKEKE